MSVFRTSSITRTNPTFALSRRDFLLGSGGVVLATFASNAVSASAAATDQYRIVAQSARTTLLGSSHPMTEVSAYNGTIPGPTLRIRQGEKVRITVENKLQEETTVHWHGIRLANAMDGVPGLTQPPILRGKSFVYEFTPPDAGTFWYHPHANSLQQLGRGLAGALIVEESNPPPVDREILWVLSDWRLTSDAQIATGFGNSMEAAMAGRIGNIVTLNGSMPRNEKVRRGERIRLRLINTSLARIMALRFQEHRPIIVAVDGQPCEPHEPQENRLVLGPAMRADVIIDMTGSPRSRYKVIDDFYDGHSYTLTHLEYDPSSFRDGSLPETYELPRNPLPEPDLATAERHELTLQGGMMSGMMGDMGDMMSRMMGGMHDMMGEMGGMGMHGADGAIWAINGVSMISDGHAGMQPSLGLTLGKSYVFTIRNATAWWHPLHIHGYSVLLVSRNGSPVPYQQWSDTILLVPRDTVDCAFVADNPGDWMLHCHVIDHQVSGLMTIIRTT